MISAFGVEHGEISKSWVGGAYKPAMKLTQAEKRMIRLRNSDRLAGRWDESWSLSGPAEAKRGKSANMFALRSKARKRLNGGTATHRQFKVGQEAAKRINLPLDVPV